MTGPFRWVPLKGQDLTVQTPTEVDVVDVNKGAQSGLNDWPGLRAVTARYLEDFWRHSIWMYHACSLCRRRVTMYGVVHTVQACCVDGCTSPRWFKVTT